MSTRDTKIGALWLVFFAGLIVIGAMSRWNDVSGRANKVDSIRTLNAIIEMDIRAMRAQNDTNWMYIDSTTYYREAFLIARDSLWSCWRNR